REAGGGDAGGDGDGGVAGQVGGDGEGARVEGVDQRVADLVGDRPLGREGLVGVGRAQHQVDLVEEVGHGLVELDPERLELGSVLGAEQVDEAQPHAELVGELVGAVGPDLVEGAQGGGKVGQAPDGSGGGEL